MAEQKEIPESGARYLIVSTMKDEAPYLLEWIAYHRVIGFTDFLIYTNDCSDGTDLMLERLTRLGIVRHERCMQEAEFDAADAHPLCQKADWVLVSDVTEYLNIHCGGGRVRDLLNACPDAWAIPVIRRVFSATGATGIHEDLITEVLTDAEPRPIDDVPSEASVATLFRQAGQEGVMGQGRAFRQEGSGDIAAHESDVGTSPNLVDTLGIEVAQVNHYVLRSACAFLVEGDGVDVDYWRQRNIGGAVDRSILKFQEEVHAEYEALCSDPILTALHEASITIHRDRARTLLKRKEIRDLFAQIAPSVPEHEGWDGPPINADPPTEQAAGAGRTEPSHPEATPEESKAIIAEILAASDRERRSPKRRGVRQKMLDEVMPKGARCAEIGVWEGDFSAEILNITKPRELVLIDPWDLLAEKGAEEHTHSQHASYELMWSKYANIMATIGRLPNCVVRKGFSAEVLESYPDHYFDWVYIDGNHLFDFVRQDIETSFRKVRPGGIIAGDDFFWKRNDRMHVREAVFDVLKNRPGEDSFTRRGQQFIIQVAV